MNHRLRILQSQISYRHPMPVREFRTFNRGNTYAVCPRCSLSMEREYVRYCSQCGQKLDWREYADSCQIEVTP